MHPPISKARTLSFALTSAALVAVAVAAEPGSATAQDKPPCDQFDWSVKREFALLKDTDLETVLSGATIASLPSKGIALELMPYVAVEYIQAPGRAPISEESFGGLLQVLSVEKAGAYNVTLSGEGWIDVIQNGKALAPIAQTGGADCETIHKSIRFEFQTGPAAFQVSGVVATQIRLAVLPAE
jgi:hypothetical protein